MKLLIVGSGPAWEQAPFEDTSYEVWTYGLIADLLPRVDIFFEMHRRDLWTKMHGVDDEGKYVERLNALDKDIFMQQEHEDIPHSIRYPLKDVEALVGPQFFGTVAYQLGLAALFHCSGIPVEQVLLFGLDLCTWEEWAHQRPNVNRLIGFLQGKGVDVKIPPSSKLFGMPYRYGYEIPEEDLHAADALIIEGIAQFSAMMARMADLHIAKKEALHANGKGK